MSLVCHCSKLPIRCYYAFCHYSWHWPCFQATLCRIQAFPTNLRKFIIKRQFLQIFGRFAKNLQKLSVYGKFPHQNVRWKSYCFLHGLREKGWLIRCYSQSLIIIIVIIIMMMMMMMMIMMMIKLQDVSFK